jgi:hypothetical protein
VLKGLFLLWGKNKIARIGKQRSQEVIRPDESEKRKKCKWNFSHW